MSSSTGGFSKTNLKRKRKKIMETPGNIFWLENDKERRASREIETVVIPYLVGIIWPAGDSAWSLKSVAGKPRRIPFFTTIINNTGRAYPLPLFF